MQNLLNKIFQKHYEVKDNTNIANNSDKKNLSKITLLTSTEGIIFIVGISISLLFIGWLGATFIFSPEKAQLLAAITAFEILFGRAACMALGYSLQFKHPTVISICIVLETTLVLISYPLFVFSWKHLLEIKRLKKIFDKIHKAAVTHQDKVRKYGIIGLFAFVMFPFWMTGPVVGSVIGFLMALPAWLNLLTVLGGTYAAIFCWAFILHAFHEKVAEDSPFAAMILMLIIVIIIIIGIFLSKVRHDTHNNNKQSMFHFKKLFEKKREKDM